ncbi:MAG: hypothetical protein ABI837_18750, partial [Acidobacteriota bacterium]
YRVLSAVVTIAVAVIALRMRGPSPDDGVDYRITSAQAKSIAAHHLTSVTGQPLSSRVIAAPLDGFRNWDSGSPREDGGGPGGFDTVAANYLVRHGMTMQRLLTVFRERIEAATWTVRFFTPQQKIEKFVEVDPRTSTVIGYHKYQDERVPGPKLDQPAAQAIAVRVFPQYGSDAGGFDLKEALAFEQPARRDWLFHFQERRPLAAEAFRRISVRVAGNEVTQFTTTVKIPDSVYRDEEKQTLLSVVFTLIRIAGIVGVLALIITGVIVASRHGLLHWRRAARWAAFFAIVPLAATAASWELRLFSYNTSVQWQTFAVDQFIDVIRTVGLQVGLFFLSVAAVDAAFPFALKLLSREGRARFGRAAIIAAATALALFTAARAAMALVVRYLPAFNSVVPVNAPDDVAIVLPGLVNLAQAAFAAVVLPAALSMFALAIGTLTRPSAGDPITDEATQNLEQRRTGSRRTLLEAAITIGSVFALTLNQHVTAHTAPALLARALVTGLVVWLVVHFVLRRNPLAVPVAVFALVVLQHAAMLLQNHRPDLVVNALAELLVLAAVMTWLAIPRSEHA